MRYEVHLWVVMCLARLGLKAMALAWLWVALAFRISGQAKVDGFGLALAWLWPEPWLLGGSKFESLEDIEYCKSSHC